MSNQYFENNDQLKSEIRELSYYIQGTTMHFYSDNGVFSKGNIDFGSRLLIQTMIECAEVCNQKDVLDVGCGYGTIGLTIAKLFPQIHMDMIDVNLRAIDLAKQNKSKNFIENAEIFASNIYENIHKKYDIIVSNPPIRAGKKVVHAIVVGAKEHLSLGGSMWCVIQKKQGAPSLIKALEENFSEVHIRSKEKGYYVIQSILN
ncbi:MAG: class I SAM-dependent methyltransferase [Prevotella sp.]|nr:class I SAM-dependent methyltransferase [Staphylococcus sp.]MCM1350495.1 class I SAM-dependent methyltransferase [Prevotella sp.]